MKRKQMTPKSILDMWKRSNLCGITVTTLPPRDSSTSHFMLVNKLECIKVNVYCLILARFLITLKKYFNSVFTINLKLPLYNIFDQTLIIYRFLIPSKLVLV